MCCLCVMMMHLAVCTPVFKILDSPMAPRVCCYGHSKLLERPVGCSACISVSALSPGPRKFPGDVILKAILALSGFEAPRYGSVS